MAGLRLGGDGRLCEIKAVDAIRATGGAARTTTIQKLGQEAEEDDKM